MKKPALYRILYDDSCPMCTLASQQLTGKNDRQPFTEAKACNLPHVDWNLGRNEVPVVNTTDQSVLYGIDGLIAMTTQHTPLLRRFLHFPPLKFVLGQGYRIIAFNRRVIAPGRIFEGQDPIAPELNYPLRWTYIILAWVITSVILTLYATQLTAFIPPTNFVREFLICGGQVLFQGVFVLLVRKDRSIHYLGNMMTISLAGALLLVPILLISPFINPILSLIWFAGVVLLMFLEHIRRVRLLKLPWFITAGWVIYRILVLGLIFYL